MLHSTQRCKITDRLAKGLSANVMAWVAGNTSATTNRYYDSLHLQLDVLREAARKAVSG